MNTSTRTKGDGDELQHYCAAIRRIPLLNAEEERLLADRIKAGDKAARARLIEANLRLVVKIARGFPITELPMIDLIQEGNIGLIKAAERFDGKRNIKFSTYACLWIKQYMARALSNDRRTIRIPYRKELLLRKIQYTFTALYQSLAREPSTAEIAAELHMDEEAVRGILSLSTVLPQTGCNEDGSCTTLDVFADYKYCPEPALLKTCMREETLTMLKLLCERERQILMYRFSFRGDGGHTLKKVGNAFGISAETVRQIEKRAIRRLKEEAPDMELLVS